MLRDRRWLLIGGSLPRSALTLIKADASRRTILRVGDIRRDPRACDHQSCGSELPITIIAVPTDVKMSFLPPCYYCRPINRQPFEPVTIQLTHRA